MSNNQHILSYLEYYAGFSQPPGYAVMINGPWGIGKTSFVTKFIEGLQTVEYQAVYVSLNGLKNFDEIDRELFRVMHTVMGSKLFGAMASLAKTGLKAVKGISIDVNVLDLVDKYTANLYVFDDLERCGMPAVQVLGYINGFVEHGHRKVIVIGFDQEIKDIEQFDLVREKVIGMTLRFSSVLSEALPAFIGKVEDAGAKGFLAAKFDIIVAIHDQAEKDNLRVLQQAIWDFERFYKAVEDKHRKNEDAMTASLRLLLALSMEVRTGGLKEDDLRERQTQIVRSMMSRNPPSPLPQILEAHRRYPASNVGSTMFCDDTLIAMLINGVFDAGAIIKDLNASLYFVDVAEEPEWRTLWHGIERTDEEVASALAKVEDGFAKRAYTIPGVILHVFGLRLRHAAIGDLGKSAQVVVAECERYVDDLYDQGRLEPPSEDGRVRLRETGYDGLQIASADSPEYRALFAYLENKQAQVASDRYPVIARELLANLRSAPAEFVNEIAPGSGQHNKYRSVPILASIDPKEFVSVWLGVHPGLQRQILDALATRYERQSLNGDLSGEIAWANDVYADINSAMHTMSFHGRYRTKIFLEHSLDKIAELTLPARVSQAVPI